jgi:hypothetical protein
MTTELMKTKLCDLCGMVGWFSVMNLGRYGRNNPRKLLRYTNSPPMAEFDPMYRQSLSILISTQIFTFAAGRTGLTTEAEFWLLDDYCGAAYRNTFCYILRSVAFQKQAIM